MFNVVSLLDILEGLISSVPEAAALYQKIAPMIVPKAYIPQADMDAVTALAPAAQAAVTAAHDAIATLVATHT